MPKPKRKSKVDPLDLVEATIKQEAWDKERKFLFRREDVRRRGVQEEDDLDVYETPSDYSHATEGRRLADGFRMLGADE